MNDTMRTDSVRLEAENARLRKGIEFIRDTVSRVLADPLDDVSGDTGALMEIETLCDEALIPPYNDNGENMSQKAPIYRDIPSGNKDPRSDEINPNGKQVSHEIDPTSAHYGSLNEWPS